ncbi:hypothetical protein RN001_009290 [Aquatica leii]|uniref:Carboxylic ester hydrolase n=1 Tax=Aquatica leii TaxID=1421715 RepID=A0AAN7PTL9_9COLE|nr:hypothetical protein RN001_009290 [Aquatica leii]
MYSYHKRIYSAFEGIPYAEPPIGDLRFEEAQDAQPWDGILEATKLHQCIQKGFTPLIFGDEDCLYVNIYVPRANPIPEENLNVVVHIHGGVFVFGDTEIAGPKYVMDRDIVYVNFNFRLNIFGFLSTGDSALPGNLGLKDQVFALKWVQKNIKFFGGNPNSVTLVGLSSGAACSHLHYFSPLSKGLFHRGMSHSGVAVAPWVVHDKPLEKAVKLGNAVGCRNSSTNELVKCLKTKSALELFQNFELTYIIPGFPISSLGPVIEESSSTAFLTDYPYVLLKKRQIHDVPWLTSITTGEGIAGLTLLNHSVDTLKDNFDYALPYYFQYHDKVTEYDKDFVTKQIKQFYFKNNDISNQNYINAFGDRTFKLPFEVAVQMQSKVNKSPVFVYIYNYTNSFRSLNWFGLHHEGVDHTEDAMLIYELNMHGVLFVPEKLSDSDVIIKDILLDTIVSFSEDRTPKYKDVSWKPVKDNKEIDYMFINKPDDVTMKAGKEFGAKTFWWSLPIQEFDKISNVKEEL